MKQDARELKELIDRANLDIETLSSHFKDFNSKDLMEAQISASHSLKLPAYIVYYGSCSALQALLNAIGRDAIVDTPETLLIYADWIHLCIKSRECREPENIEKFNFMKNFLGDEHTSRLFNELISNAEGYSMLVTSIEHCNSITIFSSLVAIFSTEKLAQLCSFKKPISVLLLLQNKKEMLRFLFAKLDSLTILNTLLATENMLTIFQQLLAYPNPKETLVVLFSKLEPVDTFNFYVSLLEKIQDKEEKEIIVGQIMQAFPKKIVLLAIQYTLEKSPNLAEIRQSNPSEPANILAVDFCRKNFKSDWEKFDSEDVMTVFICNILLENRLLKNTPLSLLQNKIFCVAHKKELTHCLFSRPYKNDAARIATYKSAVDPETELGKIFWTPRPAFLSIGTFFLRFDNRKEVMPQTVKDIRKEILKLMVENLDMPIVLSSAIFQR